MARWYADRLQGLWSLTGKSIRSFFGRPRSLIFYLISVVVLVGLTLSVFTTGMLFQKNKPSPYYSVARGLLKKPAGLVRRMIRQEVTRPSYLSSVSIDKVDTGLLPLQKLVVSLPSDLGVSGANGGLATIGNTVLVVSRQGTFLRIDSRGEEISRLELPALPNNVEAYDDDALADKLVAHDIELQVNGTGVQLYVSYERFHEKANATSLVLSVIELEQESLKPISDWRTLYESSLLVTQEIQKIGGGGRIFSGGGSVYLTIGDYNQSDTDHWVTNVTAGSESIAQNPQNDFGSIIKIDLRSGKYTTLSIGHRNPQGLLLTSDGVLFSTEHGPKGGDELNLILEGRNYGWPLETLGTDYTTYHWRNIVNDLEVSDFEPPVFSWLPSIGVSNLIEVEGFNRAWDGDILVASLKAQSLYRLRRDMTGRVVYSEPIWIGERLRDIDQIASGDIVMWTDQSHLVFLSPDEQALANNTRAMETLSPPFLAPCLTCHHLGATTPNHQAPSLSRVYGREIASDSYERYSEGLRDMDGRWTTDKLVEFLVDPVAFSAGTSMTYKVDTREEAMQIVEGLELLE